jgi:hypothetical protein
MTPEEVQALFEGDGGYAFARWGRPIVPVVFGVEDESLPVIKGAFEAVARLAGTEVAETDPELGANLMLFFLRDWGELLDVPNLDAMLPGLPDTVGRLERAGASQYRTFRFDETGAIRACFSFLRMSGGMEKLPAETLALGEAVRVMLTWSEAAFAEASPLARHPETAAAMLRPEIAGVIRAAYDPVMPPASTEPAHALRLWARMQA